MERPVAGFFWAFGADPGLVGRIFPGVVGCPVPAFGVIVRRHFYAFILCDDLIAYRFVEWERRTEGAQDTQVLVYHQSNTFCDEVACL